MKAAKFFFGSMVWLPFGPFRGKGRAIVARGHRPALQNVRGFASGFFPSFTLSTSLMTFRQSFSHAWLWGSTLTLGMGLSLPAVALTAQLDRPIASQGDTLILQVRDVNAPPNTPITVQWGDRTFPAFPLGDHYRALIPTSPLDTPGSYTLRVTGDDQPQTLSLQLQKKTFPVQKIWLSGKANSEATPKELAAVAAVKALVTPQKYWQGAFVKPNNGPISTIFGVRRYYNGVFAGDYYHRGVDYAGTTGSPVFAPAAGRIALVGYEKDGFRVHGNVIGIDHGQGVVSILMHLQRIDVKEGQFVQAGQPIATVGSTGASTGPHLHWGLYVHGVSVDPVPWRYQGVN